MINKVSQRTGISLSLLTLFGLGCGQPTKSEQNQTPTQIEQPSQPLTSTPQEPQTTPQQVQSEPETKFDFAQLNPVISTPSTSGVVADKILVELALPVGPSHASTHGTELTITPKIDGYLQFATSSRLEFVPREGFEPAKTYKVKLKSVATSQGLVNAEKNQEIHYTFKTPNFKFLRANLISADPRRRKINIDLVFSHPVNATNIHLDADIAGLGSRVRIEDDYQRPNVARVQLLKTPFRPGAPIRLKISNAKHSYKEHVAPSVTTLLNLPRGKTVTILNTSVVENASGYHIEVICSDEASSGSKYYHKGYYVSRRCLIAEEEIQSAIAFEPKLKFSAVGIRGGFRINAPFQRGNYKLHIKADSSTIDGGTILNAYEKTISIPARSAKLDFVAQGRYTSKNTNRLALRHLNINAVNLQVRRILPENIHYWLYDNSENTGPQHSDVIAKQKMKLRAPADKLTTTWVELDKLVVPQARKGILELKATSKTGHSSVRRLQFTNMNLIAKKADKSDAVDIYVIDMHSLKPIEGADVKQIVPSGRLISRCTTDKNGRCTLVGVNPKSLDQTQPMAILAQKADDFTYLAYSEVEINRNNYNTHGVVTIHQPKYRAALHTHRGVYRPGETAHVAAIIRKTQNNTAPEKPTPVTLSLIDPRSKLVKRVVLETSPEGLITQSFQFADFADTGYYTVSAKIGKKTVGNIRFNVEEFVPERMRVEAKPKADDMLFNELKDITVSARYLFGGSAEGSRVELTCNLSPSSFSPTNNKQYNYSRWFIQPLRSVRLGQITAELGKDGSADLACPPLANKNALNSTYKLSAKAAVFEAGSGRSTQNKTSATIHPAKVYLGLLSNVQKVKSGDTFDVEGIVVDWDGNIQKDYSGKVKVGLHKLEREHDWLYDEQAGTWQYQRFQRLVLDSKIIELEVKEGKFKTQFTAGSDAGNFVVRAQIEENASDLVLDGNKVDYWYWYEDEERSEDVTPKPLKPGSFALKTPQTVSLNTPFDITFTPPFAGKALVTIEADKILKQQWLDVKAQPTKWQTQLEKFYPNVYVSVLVLKDPHLESKEAFIPSRAFEINSVRIVPDEFTTKIKIDTVDKIGSNSKLNVKLDLGESNTSRKVMLALVDEGILQITRFKTPDPLKVLFPRQALAMRTYDTVGWNLNLPAAGPSGDTGGDMEMAAARSGKKRRKNAIKPIALWSGVKEVPKDGKLEVSFDIPRYQGELRLMAISVGAKKVGRAEKSITVADPIVVESTLPRFLVYQDKVDIPVFINNTSADKRDVVVKLESAQTEKISILGETEKKLTVKPGDSQTVYFTLLGKQATDVANIQVTTTSGDLKFVDKKPIPLQSAQPRVRKIQKFTLTGTQDFSITQKLDGWLAGSEQTNIWVTTNPYADIFSHLTYLLRYPFGCIEQTSSRIRPLLYLKQAGIKAPKSNKNAPQPAEVVDAGIQRILSMQTPEGGFAYWPGLRSPTYWGTAYAVHVLLDAKAAGYNIAQSRIDDALDWMQLVLDYPSRVGKLHKDALTYFHFVLANAKRGRKAAMKRMLNRLEKQLKGWKVTQTRGSILEQIFMLKAGLHAMGDHTYRAELLDLNELENSSYRSTYWSFYSDQRARALRLSILADLFGAKEPNVEILAQRVANDLRGHTSSWYTTQELAWGITGLGKIIGTVSTHVEAPVLIEEGKEVEYKSSNKKSPERIWIYNGASEFKDLTLKTKLKKDEKLYLILNSEGIRPAEPKKTGGEGLTISRTWLDAEGNKIDLKNVQLGQLVYVELELSNDTNETIQNIALIDRVPAGFEIENPRLGRGSTPNFVEYEELWSSDYLNVRDDRIEVFGRLRRGESRYVVYAVRAVSVGEFNIPSVELEAMYDPSRWARNVAGHKLLIKGPWSESQK